MFVEKELNSVKEISYNIFFIIIILSLISFDFSTHISTDICARLQVKNFCFCLGFLCDI